MENPELSKNLEGREQAKPKSWVAWAGPGHEHEYTVNFEGYGSSRDFISQQFVEKLKAMLGEGFIVDNRGSRLEIHPPQDTKPFDAHFNVAGAMQACFGEEYKMEFVNMFKPEIETNPFE
ncbi:MAG: hypothetical protein A3A97_01540 [Candidatus Terrybacteria bacterium RIFCSPLOWO2_01_FULL_40_23]|uniref:Uncharacterized protein n=1 Tax=Candidatus Terrybacteria bacterium RIFCSPLOWO2_01_FULL_40_23 TaxID=1802366 RepID=A0A1G2PQX8_9BACT|nr:MAG: hypothetical protein A3A97_01540 [Candidatus Terrybacteria bacterium RIFCSPLOWO2_01_FULL_40_23]